MNVNLSIWVPPLADLLAPEEHMAGIATVTTGVAKLILGGAKEKPVGNIWDS